VLPEKFRDAAFLQAPRGNTQHRIEESLIRSTDANAIHLQKHERGDDPSTLVAIQKWTVLHSMKDISCGHLEKVDVIICRAASCLRHGKSRLKEAQIANSPGTTVSFYLVIVDLKSFFQVEEERRQRVSPRAVSARDGTAGSQFLRPCEMIVVALCCVQA
jgi:hypothetical protein